MNWAFWFRLTWVQILKLPRVGCRLGHTAQLLWTPVPSPAPGNNMPSCERALNSGSQTLLHIWIMIPGDLWKIPVSRHSDVTGLACVWGSKSFKASLGWFKDFPGGRVVKHTVSKRCSFDPWVSKIPWSRKWQPPLVFLPEKSHDQRSLAGYSLWGCKKSNTTEQLNRNRWFRHAIKFGSH